VMIKQGKNALAIWSAPLNNNGRVTIPADKEKRDSERIQEVGYET